MIIRFFTSHNSTYQACHPELVSGSKKRKLQTVKNPNANFNIFRLKLIRLICLIATTSIIIISSLAANASFDVSPYNANQVNNLEKNWLVLKANPGQKIQDSFRITNTSSELITTKISPKDFRILEDGSFTIIADNEANTATGNWLKLDVDNVAVEPKKSSQIPVSITVPNDAKDGEYAAGISVFEVEPSSGDIKVIVRKGLRSYIAVGNDFNLGLNLNKVNILDPKDANFEDIKNKKAYFGKDNLLLEFEAENTGNIFGILQAKYALKFENGEVFEGNFATEIAPGVGKRTYYIVTNQTYRTGNTQAILDYQIKPLNILPESVKNQNVTGIVEDNLSMNQDELDNFSSGRIKFIKDDNQQIVLPELTSKIGNFIDRLKIILLVSSATLLAFGVIGVYVVNKIRSRKMK